MAYPSLTPAKYAPAAPQLHRHEIIVAACKMWPGEAHQHATIIDPLVQTVEGVGNVADIGEDQHWQTPVKETRDGFRWCRAFGKADIGEWVKRAREIVGRTDQGLRTVGSRS